MYWNAGCQLVALNFQTLGEAINNTSYSEDMFSCVCILAGADIIWRRQNLKLKEIKCGIKA